MIGGTPMAPATIIVLGETFVSFRREASAMKERQVDIVIVGAGSAGLNAMAQAREAGRSFVLINGGTAGTTCACGCGGSGATCSRGRATGGRRVGCRMAAEVRRE